VSVNPRRKTYTGPDRRALINTDGLDEATGCTVPASAFSAAAGVTDGVVPALYPVVVNGSGVAAPWTAGALTGLLVDPVDTSKGDASVGVMRRGYVDPTLLPVDASAGTGSQLIFIANGA
jgi:hypothetical protein